MAEDCGSSLLNICCIVFVWGRAVGFNTNPGVLMLVEQMAVAWG